MKYQGMVITDLDGTLLKEDHQFCERDLNTLDLLKSKGYCRVIATGRSLFSLQKIVAKDFPIDYVIFSSGAGIVHWKTGELIYHQNLSKDQYFHAIDVLKKHNMDFMLHDPVPENHHFFYFKSGAHNADFEKRIEIYKNYAQEEIMMDEYKDEACQLIAICDDFKIYQIIKDQLPALKVIRTTSPLNKKSTWIEIFHPSVSKGFATLWLCQYVNIPVTATLGIGNDYNDIDLLLETRHSYVVSNAPEDLKNQFNATDSNNANGFTKAVQLAFQMGYPN